MKACRKRLCERKYEKVISALDHCRHGSYTKHQLTTLTPNLPKTMTLTKRDLVIRISEETGLVQQQVLDIVQKTLDYIAEALAKGDKVELRNFGVFEIKVRKARIGRNPNAPETDVPIPERSVVKFKPGKAMRAEVLKLQPPPKTATIQAVPNLNSPAPPN